MTLERLILHIGPHKTGTTAIQKRLVEAAPYLRSSDMLYPTNTAFVHFGHHRLADQLLRRDIAVARNLACDLLDAAKAADARTLVLSSENFSQLAPDLIAEIPALLPARETTVVIARRNFLQLPYAWWQETVRHGNRLSFAHFLAQMFAEPRSIHLLQLPELIDNGCVVFGATAIHVIDYDEAVAQDGGITPAFFRQVLQLREHVWEKQPLNPTDAWVNLSFSPVEAELIRLLNGRERRGIDVFLQNPQLRETAQRIASTPPLIEFLDRFVLSYELPLFAEREARLRQSLERLDTQHPLKNPLFAERQREVAFVDGTFWAALAMLQPDIIQQVIAASGRDASPRAMV